MVDTIDAEGRRSTAVEEFVDVRGLDIKVLLTAQKIGLIGSMRRCAKRSIHPWLHRQNQIIHWLMFFSPRQGHQTRSTYLPTLSNAELKGFPVLCGQQSTFMANPHTGHRHSKGRYTKQQNRGANAVEREVEREELSTLSHHPGQIEVTQHFLLHPVTTLYYHQVAKVPHNVVSPFSYCRCLCH